MLGLVNHRMPRLAAAGLALVGTAAMVGGTALVVVHHRAQGGYGTWYGDLVLAAALWAFTIMGWLVVRRQPSNVVGWLLLVAGVVVEGGGLLDEAAAGAGDRLFVVFLAALVLLTLVFPDGRALSPRWRPVAWLVGAVTAVALVLPAAVLLLAAIVPAALISVGLRYHRARVVERLQLRWVLTAAAFVLLALVVGGVVGAELEHPLPLWFRIGTDVSNASIGLLPAAIGAAVLKHRLWAIDSVLDKTLVLTGVATFTTGVYVIVVGGVGALLGSDADLPLTIAATVVVALTLQPVRRRIDALAGRLVYGRDSSPYAVLTGFARRVAVYAADDGLLEAAHSAAVAARGVRGEAWLQLDDRLVRRAAWPVIGDGGSDGEQTLVPVMHGGVQVGALSVVKSPGDRLLPQERDLLADVASQAGPLFSNVALTAELQQRLQQLSTQTQELTLSRQRIVTSQDRVRQRIERDLHDGAQQRLVALGVTLQRLHGNVDPATQHLVDEATSDLREALKELRDLARGIHPALLTEVGLADAVRALVTRAPIAAQLVATPEGRYDLEIETTAYFIVSEAITNVAKHAADATASVRLEEVDGELVVTVSDTGHGGADPARGSGLRGLQDRVAAVGGRLSISSEPDGTRLRAELPCA
jgi:signal transduction histidine kinase